MRFSPARCISMLACRIIEVMKAAPCVAITLHVKYLLMILRVANTKGSQPNEDHVFRLRAHRSAAGWMWTSLRTLRLPRIFVGNCRRVVVTKACFACSEC